MDERTSIAYAGHVFGKIKALFAKPAFVPGQPSSFAPAVPASQTVTPPIQRQGGYVWSLEKIREARNAQLRGDFTLPVRLAEAMRTDDALFTAYVTRVSTQSAIALQWRQVETQAGRRFAKRAQTAIVAPQHVRESILGTLANHGIAIGYVQQSTEDDPAYGPTTKFLLTEWPLEFVRYYAPTLTLQTRTQENGLVTITHGDGRWIVFRKFGHAPWTQDACVLPGGLVWAAHAEGVSDWAGASSSHGQPKLLGTLREGVPFNDGTAEGNLSPEAQFLLNTIAGLAGSDSPAGIIPAGADAKLLFNGSNAWQVFKELVLDRGKAATRIYLGTDAILGSQGGAPGVDVASLLEAAGARIRSDLQTLERGYCEGMIQPWADLHGFSYADAPAYVYALPDPDAERRGAQEASALDRLNACVKSMRDAGLAVTQDTINALAQVLNVTVTCALAAQPLDLNTSGAGAVVTVREARATQGLPELGDERDDLTLAELGSSGGGGAAADPADPNAPTDGTDAPPDPETSADDAADPPASSP